MMVVVLKNFYLFVFLLCETSYSPNNPDGVTKVQGLHRTLIKPVDWCCFVYKCATEPSQPFSPLLQPQLTLPSLDHC